MSLKAPDFDWVSARFACTAGSVFNDLRGLAEVNVETRSEHPNAGTLDFRASAPGSTPAVFTVRRICIGETYSVRFRLVNGVIRIDSERLNPPIEPFEVQVKMDDDGRCVCVVDGQIRLLWQILHRALDSLLFGHYPI